MAGPVYSPTLILNSVPFSDGGSARIRAKSSESSHALFLFPPPMMDSNFFRICLFRLGRRLSP